jgi:hypothetical protein
MPSLTRRLPTARARGNWHRGNDKCIRVGVSLSALPDPSARTDGVASALRIKLAELEAALVVKLAELQAVRLRCDELLLRCDELLLRCDELCGERATGERRR